MSKYRYIKGTSSVIAMSLGLAMVSAYAADDEVISNERTATIDTIIVTGEKTERSLKDTASSVSVIPEETLQTLQHQTISDAVSEIANVVSLSGAVPDIRGVSGNGSSGGFNSISGGAKARVSIIVDDVAEPFVADLTGDSGLWDIEQIEVYRGPQSTSNGRNSIAGSINIKTKDPSFDWEGAARLGYRNKDQYIDKAFVVSGPLVEDTLAFRLSAQRLDAETISSDEGYTTNEPDYDLNELTTNRLRAKLLWTPVDNFEALLSYSGNNEEGDSGRRYLSSINPSAREKIFYRDIETDSDTFSLKMDYKINNGMSLDVLVAYMTYDWGFDSYEAIAAAEQQLQIDEEDLTFDTKLNFGLNGDVWSGFVGFAYSKREQDIVSTGPFNYFGDDESDSKAVYGEVNYALTPVLKLTAGGRVERESQHRNFTFAPIVALLDQEKTIVLPKVALQYDLSEKTSLILSARRGYNPAGGALNFAAQEYYFYDEETVNTFEAGIRSNFADGRINLSANIFYNDYDGYQALSTTRFIVNMEEVTTYGAELEIFARPTENIDLTASLGLLHTEINDAGETYSSANGNELNSAPKFTINVGAKYWFNDQINVGGSVKYIDDYFGEFANTEEREAGGYTVARLNANYETDSWLVSGFINNVFDEDEFLTREPVSGRYPLGFVAIVEPRNVGVSLTYKF